MQSNRNSFSGDVILDSVSMAYRDEDTILDQIYVKQIHLSFLAIYLDVCQFHPKYRKQIFWNL